MKNSKMKSQTIGRGLLGVCTLLFLVSGTVGCEYYKGEGIDSKQLAEFKEILERRELLKDAPVDPNGNADPDGDNGEDEIVLPSDPQPPAPPPAVPIYTTVGDPNAPIMAYLVDDALANDDGMAGSTTATVGANEPQVLQFVPPEPSNSEPQNTPEVESLVLKIKTGDIENGGTDCEAQFDLCPTDTFDSDACFHARFNTTNNDNVTLDRGRVDTIDFSRDDGLRIGGKLISKLDSNDFKFFRISVVKSSCEDHPHPGWFIRGIELLKNGEPVYRNPCVDRWLEPSKPWYESKFSRDDVALCLETTTGLHGEANAGDRSIFAEMPLNHEGLDGKARDWIGLYHPTNSLRMTTGRNTIKIYPDYGGYNDFFPGSVTRYGATCYHCSGGLDEGKLRIGNRDSDGWLVTGVKAHVFWPGKSQYTDLNNCFANHWSSSTGIWVDPTDDRYHDYWTGDSGRAEYADLGGEPCPGEIREINNPIFIAY